MIMLENKIEFEGMSQFTPFLLIRFFPDVDAVLFLKFSSLASISSFSDFVSSRTITSSGSTKFLHFSQSHNVIFSADWNIGNLLSLHCLQNNGMIFCISASISINFFSFDSIHHYRLEKRIQILRCM